jgi:hypothetical protein
VVVAAAVVVVVVVLAPWTLDGGVVLELPEELHAATDTPASAAMAAAAS